MGFFDFFKFGSKTPQLPSGDKPKSQTNLNGLEDGLDKYKVDTPIAATTTSHKKSEVDKNLILDPASQTTAFSETDPTSGNVVIKLKRASLEGNMVDLATLSERMDRDSLKALVKALDMCLNAPREKGGLNPKYIEELKTTAKENLSQLAQHKKLELSPEVTQIIDAINVQSQLIVYPEATLDYGTFKKQIPKIIDVSEMEFDELMQYGDGLTSRLEALSSITSPEAAYLHKDSLISFMQYQEEASNHQGKLLAIMPDTSKEEASPEDIIKQNTIIECAQAIDEPQNEDSLLYSAYLKLEEKRILTQMQADMKKFQTKIGLDMGDKVHALQASGLTETQIRARADLMVKRDIDTYRKTEEFVDIIEQSKIHPEPTMQDGSEINSSAINNEVIGYMANVRTSDSMADYIANGFRHDIAMKAFIARHPEIENSQSALDYLNAKIQSTGQVTDIPKPHSLRGFIESTEYKAEPSKEIFEFLLSVAQMEKQYLTITYAPIITAYQKQMQKQTVQFAR